MRLRNLIVLLAIVLGALGGRPAMANPCPSHSEVRHHSTAAHQHQAVADYSSHHEKSAPVNDPCKIACAALCMTACTGTLATLAQQVVHVALLVPYLHLPDRSLTGLAMRPPLHPPSRLSV